jgi:lysozyme family protein
MAANSFEPSLAHVLKHEGGYVNHPADPGGATNLGITAATLARARGHPVSAADVAALTRAEAAAIYRRFFWNSARGDDLPAGLDHAVFDLAVNSGPGRAARLLQRVLAVAEDGVIGPATLAAAQRAEAGQTIRALQRERLAFLKRLFAAGRRASRRSSGKPSLSRPKPPRRRFPVPRPSLPRFHPHSRKDLS